MAVEAADEEADADLMTEGREIRGMPAVAAVHGPARVAARWASGRGSATVGKDLDTPRVRAPDLLDAAPRQKRELVHSSA